MQIDRLTDPDKPCRTCGGTGMTRENDYSGGYGATKTVAERCRSCGGSGHESVIVFRKPEPA